MMIATFLTIRGSDAKTKELHIEDVIIFAFPNDMGCPKYARKIWILEE